MITYAPSSAPLPTPDDDEVVGHFTTLAIGFAAFQVFTVDYVAVEHRKAVAWNPDPPKHMASAIQLIWPHHTSAGDIVWSPPAFSNDSFDRLASWDMTLRRGAA